VTIDTISTFNENRVCNCNSHMNILARRLTNRLVSGVRFTKSHLARGVLMVRPVDFTYNPETAKDNEFMKKGTDDTLKRALSEYDKSAQLLR
jgi:hypothetical protein